MLEFGRAKPPREVTRTATEVNANVTEGVFGSRSRDIDLPGTRPPSTPAQVEIPRVKDATAERLLKVIRGATASGVSYEEVRKRLGGSMVETPRMAQVWEAVASKPYLGLTDLEKELKHCRVADEHAMSSAVMALEQRFRREIHSSVELVVDSDTHVARTWWPAGTATEPRSDERRGAGVERDRGRVVLVGVQGAQVGENNTQVNVFVREVENPEIDFEALTRHPAVATTLAELASDPTNDEARQAAIDALSQVRQPATDWTTAYASTGSAVTGAGAPRLDGTVAVVRSRSIQVGDHQYQENTILHTVSPEIAATLLLGNSDVVNGFIDVACTPGDAGATAAFERAINSTLVSDLANSSASRRGHGSAHRPPAAGRTLRITNAAAVSVGKRVSQKTEFAQTAHLGRNVQTSAHRVATEVRRHRSPPTVSAAHGR